MSSANRVFLIGNVGKDPDTKFTPDGLFILKFSVATNEKVKKGDEYIDKTDWHNIVMFGNYAEKVSEYIHKGNKVWVEGRISNNTYEDEMGTKHYTYSIIANTVRNLTPKGESDSKANKNTEDDTEELPF